MNALNVFVRLARTIGKDIYLAQAGGGNISFKRDDGSTLIKASGCHLSEVGPSKGWVAADQRAMAKALVSLRSEKDYADFIARFSRGAEKPMSMEAGFHVLIPHRIVLHVHSLAGITLGLLPNAKIKRLIQAAMKDHVEVHLM